jgi:hypothetical protein
VGDARSRFSASVTASTRSAGSFVTTQVTIIPFSQSMRRDQPLKQDDGDSDCTGAGVDGAGVGVAGGDASGCTLDASPEASPAPSALGVGVAGASAGTAAAAFFFALCALS